MKPEQPLNANAETVKENVNEAASSDEVSEAKPAKGKKASSQFGNNDSEKKYDLSKLKIPADHYVVRHFSNVALANGQSMEDPTTSRFQVYDVDTFKRLNDQPVKDGKQVASQFQSMGLNVDVLHDPTV